MANIKISQLTAKSTNLLATDLLEVSEVSGLTYVSKKITGQQIIDGIGLSNYVPYTGASANVNLGEYEIKVGQLTLDTSPTGTAAVGTTRWNNTLGSTETTLKGGSVILKNGVDLVARVVNKVTPNTTLTKAAYPVVKVSGAQGGRLAVAYAQANNDSNSADTLGVVTETIATNQEGFIITVGQLEDINTTGSLQGETWADGDVLYLSPTIPGAITKVKPTGATGHIVIIGYVEYAHANNGKIYVKIMNGWELDELHNVYINAGTLANNDALIYESSTQLWKNKTIAQALGFTPEDVANKSTNTSLGTSDTLYPTQNAVKTYADNLLGNANALVYKGTIDCSTDPNYPAADAGWMYIASVAGKIGGASGVDVEVGDMIICKTDGSPSGNQATVGDNWNIIQKNIIGAVSGPGSSVNNNVAFFDGTTGKIIKDSGITLSGTNTGDQTLSGLGGIPTSRTITINGTTQDLSADRTFTVSSGITVGTTAVTSGTDGRVFFQAGGVVQQDAAFFWDNTNKALEIGGGTSSQEILNRVKIGHDNTNQWGYITSSSPSFRRLALVPSTFYNGQVTINRQTTDSAASSTIPFVVSSNAPSQIILTSRSINAGNSLGIEFNFNDGVGANTGNICRILPDVEALGGGGFKFDTAPNSSGSYATKMVLKRDGSLGIGNTSPGARLDVRAQGALSTDIAFRVRNSADSANILSVLGSGELFVGNSTTQAGQGHLFNIRQGAATSIPFAYFDNNNNNFDVDRFCNVKLGFGLIATTATHSIVLGSGSVPASRNFQQTMAAWTAISQGTNDSGFAQTGADTAGNNAVYTNYYGRNIVLGGTTQGTGTQKVVLYNGVAPTTTIANAGQLYVESGALRYRDSNGVITNAGGTVQSVASAATVTPVATNKFVKITAQAAALTLAAPTGTIADGQDLMIRIKDNGSAQTITWTSGTGGYRAIGVTLPTTTTAGKTTYVGLIYNSDDSVWDAIGVTTQA